MRGVIGWFARNGVAANLLMIFIVVWGLLGLTGMPIEVFPSMEAQNVSVTVPYLGAAPEEVEQGVCLRVEEAVQDLEGVDTIRSTAAEGVGTVVIELESNADVREVLDQVKSRVDAITTFPEETEKPIIQEALIRRRVITVAAYGDVDERALKTVAEQMREGLSELPDITQVELDAVRPYEISIEVSEDTLRQYGLTFDEVVLAVRRSSLDLPGGAVRAREGEILLRTMGQAYRGAEYRDIVLRARPDGSRLVLGDIARVTDGFAETDVTSRFDGQPVALVQVYRVGDQSALRIARQVKAFVAERSAALPPGVEITTWLDDTVPLRDRLRVLLESGRLGLLLVFLVLALFLKLRLALWVSVGIAVSFMGALIVLPYVDVSINVMSLFAFILVLGIVVDDAIVVGENIYRHFEMGKRGMRAAVDGARQVATPVTFSILTTVAAFSPLIYSLEGPAGAVARTIPLVVIGCLAFSLIESMLVLPNHLSHLSHRREERVRHGVSRGWYRFQGFFADRMKRVIERGYRPLIERAVEWRYTTVAIAVAVLVITAGYSFSGRMKFEFFPDAEADNAVVLLTMPQGTPAETTRAAVTRIEEAASELGQELRREGHGDVFRHLMATVGSQPFAILQRESGPAASFEVAVAAPHEGEVNIELMSSSERTIRASEVVRRWREKVGSVPDAVRVEYTASLVSFGAAVDVELTGANLGQLRAAGEEIKARLADYPGVFDISDSFRAGKREIRLELDPRAESLGLSLEALGRQVRQGFYGAEAQRIQRGRDDVRVMVRYPLEERETLASLEDMRIRTPTGAEVPFSFAGRAEFGRGFATIQRIDRRRVLNITADVDPAVVTANEVVGDLQANVLPELLASYPGINSSFAGEQEEQRQTFEGLFEALGVALIIIYALLAIPFRSYLQPMIVMSAIPFGLIGAVMGHLVVGLSLTMLSLLGLIALTGVVVNDSLVMVDFINRRVAAGMKVHEAIRDAGAARFRPIVLTSLTTFVGLLPLLLERSFQAQFLVPMAVSLAFGVLFATAITLVLVPSLYAILNDFRSQVTVQRRKPPAEPQAGGATDAVLDAV
ncbi:MAG: efflux RND transporter permease subunit [Acidobacteria bacterium]|nr:efflux RND transporter permease subunit [Acidobacteriota bacterium]